MYYRFSITIIVLLIYFCACSTAISFPNVYPLLKVNNYSSKDAGEPLILTPFISNGSIALGQKLATVPLTEELGIKSYAGFFTIDQKYNSNLYFWYFPPLSNNESAPILLWLQGGPGATSLFGLFTELGPLAVGEGGFSVREDNWAKQYHLIFIDNPVGTGFSFTDYQVGYCTNEDCIGIGLYSAMQQFLTLFPKLRKNEFFITGESYAGKYIPALAQQIHIQNMNGNVKHINLKGMAMGNAYCDPINQIDYGNYLYQHGLLDFKEKDMFEQLQAQIVSEIKNNNWKAADILMDKLMDGELGNYSYFKTFTGFNYYYNYLRTDDDTDMTPFAKMLSRDDIRRSVHVGNRPFNSGLDVQLSLINDILKSQASIISDLLSHYRILFYNGQLDIIVAYPLTESFLRNLQFSSASEYKTATRRIWRVGDDIAGYYKKAGNLTEVLVRNAGHMVPHDQPQWALDMITRFVNNHW